MSNNKGIPTIGVRGIQFRSRIEAQWAYIFEKLGWNWEYEPIDLEGYIPDFIIKFGDEDILIEIKGDTNIWKEEVYKPHVHKIIKSGWKGMFGILGSIYKITDDFRTSILTDDEDIQNNNNNKFKFFYNKKINIGKLYQNKWKLCDENWNSIDDDTTFNYDDILIVYSDVINKFFLDGLENYDILDYPSYDRKDTFKTDISEYFQQIWVEAKNSVQWKGQQNLQQNKKNIRNNNNQQLEKLQTIKEVLLHPLISDTDKKRLMRCYEKVKLHFDIYYELPIWGNTDVFIDNKSYIYKVNYDKSIQYLQTNDMNRYKKITFNGVPQSPIEMNQNDFIN